MPPFLAGAIKAFRIYYSVCLIGVIALLISENHLGPELVNHFLRDVGISLVIAFAVIITIERTQRSELNDFIQRSMSQTHSHLFQTIFGVEFPQEVWNFLRDRVMRKSFFRSDTHVIYTIKIPPNAETRYGLRSVILEMETLQNVINMTGSDINYNGAYFIERDPSESEASRAKNEPAFSITRNGEPVPESDIRKADDKWNDTQDFKRFQYDIPMTAHGTPGGSLTLGVKMKMYSKLIADTEVWRSIYTCDGVSFIINFPKELNVRVDAIHADPLDIIHRSDTVISGRISAPLLPHNGFMFWWTPADHNKNQSSSAVCAEEHSGEESSVASAA